MAAAAAVLLPEHHSMSTSQRPDVSTARHRRRQTNRRAGTLKSVKQNELEDSTLKLSHLNPFPPTHNDPGFTPINIQTTETEFTSVSTSKTTENGETARQRRSRTRRKDPRTVTTTNSTTVSHSMEASLDLEDSTAGVANLLQKKLSQSDFEQTQQSESDQTDGTTVIPNPAASPDLHERRDEPPVLDTVAPISQQDDGEQSVEHDGGTVIERPLPRLDTANEPTNDPDVLSEPVNTNEIFGITIHGCDTLRASVHISHPCVRVSIVDTSEAACGSYVKKSHREKCVMSFYERGNPAVDYIMPILTQPFESKENSNSLQPMWEETLIFNEHPTYFTTKENLVIFFEVLDFSTAKQTSQSQVGNNASPWYKVAWAFAYPSGKIGKENMGIKCRLQLHRYPKRFWRRTTTDEEVFDLWARNYRVNYPSTLYVTLKVVPTEQIDRVPSSLQPNRRSMFPTQREEGSVTYEQLLLKQQATKSSPNLLTQSTVLSASARLPNQACHIPSTLHSTLHPTKMGCSTLAFSNSGMLLAAGCADQNVNYPMVIFEVPSFKPLLVTEGHRGIIYSVCWRQDDKLLASTSADGLVKLWSLETIVPEPVATLPHPCYVYSVCFASGGLIFTGAYDSNIRVWTISSGSPQLLSELRGCSGLVNCLVWSRKDRLLYSGDSKGRVCVWKENRGEWNIQRIISAVNNGVLTSMSLHPNGRKLLLHTDRGRLVMVDLRIDRVCCEYKGLLVSQSQRFSSLLSPCGGLLFAGGANGEVHVWNCDNGKLLHSYSDLPFKHCAMCAMDFHPNEHMLALSAFGTHEPIVVLTHLMQYGTTDKNTTGGMSGTRTEGDKAAVMSSSLMPQNSTRFRATQRLTEATKTLNGVSISKRKKKKQDQ